MEVIGVKCERVPYVRDNHAALGDAIASVFIFLAQCVRDTCVRAVSNGNL